MLGADHRRVTARARGVPSRRSPAPGFGRMVAAALLALPLATLGGPGAVAVEWIVGGSVSQRLQFESNADLEEDGGALYGATTALGLDFTALTPTTQWQFETGASVGFFGGSADDEDGSNIYPNLAAAVSHNGKYVDLGGSFGFDLQPARFAQLDETGIIEGDATQLSVRLAADASFALDPRNSLSVGGSGRIIRFTQGSTTLEPTTTVGANLAWIRNLSPATQASLSLGARRFTSKGDDDPESLTFSLAAGAGHTVTSRLSFDASLGLTATRTTRTLFGQQDTEFSLGALGDLALAWQPAPDTQLVFALSHGLEPSELGELETTTAIGAGLQHQINSWTSAGIDVLLQRQKAGGGFEEEEDDDDGRIYASISPSIAFTLTPDWALRAGYTLRLQRESGEVGSNAVSNGVFLSLTRAFDILP